MEQAPPLEAKRHSLPLGMARVLLLLLLVAEQADAHGALTYPIRREAYWVPGVCTADFGTGTTYPGFEGKYGNQMPCTQPPNQNFSAGNDAHNFQQNNYPYEYFVPALASNFRHTKKSYRCHDMRSAPPGRTRASYESDFVSIGDTQSRLVAGQTFEIEWNLQANHPGDCALYMSYDEDKDEPERWIKLFNFVGCAGRKGMQDASHPYEGFDGFTLNLPSWLPSCEHCVLRWEWYAIHTIMMQQYVTCADVAITGTDEPVELFMQKISPILHINGAEHLRGYVRRAYGKNIEIGEEYILGPAVATYAGQAPPTSPSSLYQFPPSTSIVPSPSHPHLPSQSDNSEEKKCGNQWDSCTDDAISCCAPYKCFQQHQYYSQCLLTCPNNAEWSCFWALTDNASPSSAPTNVSPPTVVTSQNDGPSQVFPSPPPRVPPPFVVSSSPPPAPYDSFPVSSPPPPMFSSSDCVAEWGNCHRGQSCCDYGQSRSRPLSCYRKDEWYSQCRGDCPQGWPCSTAIPPNDEPNQSSQSPMPPPPSQSHHYP